MRRGLGVGGWFPLAAAVAGIAACATGPTGFGAGERPITLLAYSPDGSVLATARAGENRITLLDAQSLAERRVLSGGSAEARTAARALGFSREGSRLAAAGIDDTVIVWDAASGAELFRQDALRGAQDATLSPDGSLVAVAGPGSLASVWRIADQQRVAELKGHFEDVAAIAVSHDGKTIATGSADRTVRLWPFPGTTSETLPAWHRAAVTELVFSPDDALLAVSAGLLNLWRLADRRSLAHALEPAEPTSVPPGAKALAALLMIVASARSMQLGGGPLGAPPIRGVTHGPAGSDLQTAFSPDGRLIAVLRRVSPTWGQGEVLIAEVAGKRVTRIVCDCFAIAFRPDGRAIATGGKEIQLWNAESGQPLAPGPVR